MVWCKRVTASGERCLRPSPRFALHSEPCEFLAVGGLSVRGPGALRPFPNPASVVDFAHLSAVDSAHHSFPATIHDRHGHLVNVTRSIDSCTLYRFSEMCVSVSHLAVLMNAQ